MGRIAAIATCLLSLFYLALLGGGLASLPDPDSPIADPWFTAMELCILALMPPFVAIFAALLGEAEGRRRAWAALALAFATACAALTMTLHFGTLVLSRQPQFAAQPLHDLLFVFRWPSLAYAVDILAWDVFYPLAVLSLVPSFRERAMRGILIVSGLLALAGLAGVATGDMQLRNIGILGYGVLLPVLALLLARHFSRATGPQPESG